MTTIQIRTSVEQLLDAVSQLPPEEIASLTKKLIALRASHSATHVEADEAQILLQINRAPAAALRQRYDELVAKRKAETLSDTEHTELITLSNEYERLEFERVQSLANLARLRQKSLSDLMIELGIQQPNNV